MIASRYAWRAAVAAVLLAGSAQALENAPTADPTERPPLAEPTTPTFHHRVTWMGDPSKEAVLSWSTHAAGTKHRILYDTVSHAGKPTEYTKQAPTFKDGQYTFTAKDEGYWKPAFYHHAYLNDLAPNTTYFVTYASDENYSPEFHFRTAPGEDVEFSVLAGGDSRIGTEKPYQHEDRRNMNRRMSQLLTDHDDIIALLHGGDYCMTASWRHIGPWLSDNDLTTTANGRLLPIVPTRGNHDSAIGFEEMFSWPEMKTPYYYATQLSPKVGVVTLNTEISVAGDQRDWLAHQLPIMRESDRWVLAMYHRPSFSSVRDVQDGAGRRNNWVSLFEQFNIDLVYESHDHALKRTLPIRAMAPDLKNGIIYIGDGGLGVPQRKPDPDRWWLQPPGFAKSVHHVHTIHFGKAEMHVQAHGMDGEILDDFTVKPHVGAEAVGAAK